MQNGFASAADKSTASRALALPPVPYAFSELFRDFLTLDGRRPSGMGGISAVPIVEMVGLGAALYGGYQAHEIETLLVLDSLRLRCSSDTRFVETFFDNLLEANA